MLLRRLRLRDVLGRLVLRRFRRRHVDVHVLVNHRVLLRRTVAGRGRPVAAAAATPSGGWEVRADRRLRRRFRDRQRDRRAGDRENRALLIKEKIYMYIGAIVTVMLAESTRGEL